MGGTVPTRKASHTLSGAAAAIALLFAAFALTSLFTGSGAAVTPAEPFVNNPTVPCETPAIAWADSKPVGRPFRRGRLRRGVQLPSEGDDFFTWDFPYGVAPNRYWRRWATDGTIRILLQVLCEFRTANPDAPRIGIADLSRPRGGWFGRKYGGHGHSSHQNGLDIDLIYPRLDRLEAAPTRARQIDRYYAQELVDRFVAAGAEYVFVGPKTGLYGPRGIVQRLYFHDDHMHVRIPRALATQNVP